MHAFLPLGIYHWIKEKITLHLPTVNEGKGEQVGKRAKKKVKA
jgi:hypothetical protein